MNVNWPYIQVNVHNIKDWPRYGLLSLSFETINYIDWSVVRILKLRIKNDTDTLDTKPTLLYQRS